MINASNVMKMIRSALIGALALLSAASAGVLAAEVEIMLRERVACESSVVRLGDVATILGGDQERSRQLAGLLLMPAPAPGTERYLRKREVEDMLSAQGVDLREIRFEGAEQVAISGKRETDSGAVGDGTRNRHAEILAGGTGQPEATKLDDARTNALRGELERTIISYLTAKTGQAAGWRVCCEVADRHLALLADASSRPQCRGGSEPWTGKQRFVILFTSSQGSMQVPVYAEVTAPSTPVVVAIQPIGRGDVITAAHLELQTIDYVPSTNQRRSTYGSIEQLVGREARQPIQAGEIVFTDKVQEPVLVKRGDLISITTHGGGIRVRTTARARQDATKGELVQVESLDTRECFDVRVVGPREAAVFVASRPAPAEAVERIDTARRGTQ
jgi:flagella basal body P-ring formation protein FlgA